MGKFDSHGWFSNDKKLENWGCTKSYKESVLDIDFNEDCDTVMVEIYTICLILGKLFLMKTYFEVNDFFEDI